MNTKIRIEVEHSASDRRRAALVSAGVAPSHFGKKIPGRVHKDRKAASRRGERKHKAPWG